jgi:hypothetical protein
MHGKVNAHPLWLEPPRCMACAPVHGTKCIASGPRHKVGGVHGWEIACVADTMHTIHVMRFGQTDPFGSLPLKSVP